MPSNPGDNKTPTGVHATDVARAGYEGYGDWTAWKTFDGRDMPSWDDLPSPTQLAWVAASGAIARKLFRPVPHASEDGG